MPRKRKPLFREGEPTETTKTGLEVPIPIRRAFFDLLNRAAQERPLEPEQPSPPDPESR
jgi:hypothetical protein